MSDKNTSYINGIEAHWMHNKQRLNEAIYNVQSAVDIVSNLFVQ